MRWDGMGWDGMGWDGMGWDGMGWDFPVVELHPNSIAPRPRAKPHAMC